MTIAQAEAVLVDLPRFAVAGSVAYRPGLERMRGLLAAMGDPHRAAPVIHIAGTNGKGSTASMVAAIGTAAGLRVGLHTSPHLLRVTERFRLDGEPAPDIWLAEAVGRFAPIFREQQPSFFEATTALAFRYFADEQVDLMVVEVGLGGRLDATNVVEPAACAVTMVGLDHTDLLGDTLETIAREKAGIAKPGIPLLTTATSPALGVLESVARGVGAPFEDVRGTCRVEEEGGRLAIQTPKASYRDVRLGLTGKHQVWNATLAVRLAETACHPTERAVLRGLAETATLSGLRGRAEVLYRHPLLVADVAHNPDGLATALATARAHLHPNGRLVALVGLMRDKDAAGVAYVLRAADQVWTVGMEGERAHTADSLAAAFQAAGVEAERVGTVAAGWRRFRSTFGPENGLLCAGSHGVAAAAIALREAG
jgi:dihydrofolate synthase/folylpolyglutamate synthase